MPNPHFVIFANAEMITPDFISIFCINKYHAMVINKTLGEQYHAMVINKTLGEQYKKNNSNCRSVIPCCAVIYLKP